VEDAVKITILAGRIIFNHMVKYFILSNISCQGKSILPVITLYDDWFAMWDAFRNDREKIIN
jgi:hypothetical protein